MKRKSPFAFSLVEVLVVIGLIAILIALLLPVLATSRERGKTVQCASKPRRPSSRDEA